MGDPKKATKELCCAVFGWKILATHSLTGKTSNAFRNKEAKPSLDPGKTADIIHFINAKTGMEKKIIKQAISQKCSDEEKISKRKLSSEH
ncbi:protein insensitive-like [Acipenser oxyrinchus oxyrinchus]|uniref:Protein insensitive-like n=1 Tax=Acipenser oxyrinchus oxyrinchus TaxID=40147 RepID=A0AAD8G8W2_ACIOX|nr:protein insensitive-like [Acipenser oxyrinchus oxyrinchus]